MSVQFCTVQVSDPLPPNICQQILRSYQLPINDSKYVRYLSFLFLFSVEILVL